MARASIGWGIRAVIRLACRVTPILVFAYGVFLIERLDVSRAGVAARARTVETDIVPRLVTGPSGRSYNAAIELSLSLPAERVPDFVKDAFITREDQQFRSWWHIGVNPVSIARAILTNAENWANGRPAKWVGGSTITMQLTKNLLLHQRQTLSRYLDQVILAVYLEMLFSKDEILAMYLNTAYFGNGAYGIEIAARKFFGRSVGYKPKVNLLEAAMLAKSIQAPSNLNPNSDRSRLEDDARRLITAMAGQGYDIGAGEETRSRGNRDWSISPFLFRDVAMRFLVPPELDEREERTIVGLTIDPEAQLYAERAASDLLNSARDSGYDSSAIIVLAPDGAIIALATGHTYDGTDVVRNGRVSPGSTLKPFMFLCALENGLRPNSLVPDEQRAFGSEWIVRNFDGKYYGAVTLDFALTKSRNTTAAELFGRFGPECFADVLRRVGIKLDNPREPTAVLGSQYVPLLQLAGAYASLANGGRKVAPYAVRYARARQGDFLFRRAEPKGQRRVAGEQPYCDLMRMLRHVASAEGTGRNAAFSHPVWGKTGTSSGYRDALFAGFTGHYAAVVWLGRQARGGVNTAITGGELPAETFRWLMATLHEGREVIDLGCDLQIASATQASTRQ